MSRHCNVSLVCCFFGTYCKHTLSRQVYVCVGQFTIGCLRGRSLGSEATIFIAFVMKQPFSLYLLLFCYSSMLNFVNTITLCCILFELLILHKTLIIRVRRLKGPRADYVPALGLTSSVTTLLDRYTRAHLYDIYHCCG